MNFFFSILGNIELHLSSLYELVKYFFAHNNLNYSRLMPIYLHSMNDVRKNDKKTWSEFEKGNFVVTKNSIGFTSLAPDHAIEQEIKILKGTGGIVGITQKTESLER
jgi:hypothetical protein